MKEAGPLEKRTKGWDDPKRRKMKKFTLPSHLGLIFILAVVIPAIIMALVAIRAINREEAYIEKRLEGSLLAEAKHVVFLVNTELRNIQEELLKSIPPVPGQEPGGSFSNWKQLSPLVSVPFLLSPDYQILWPSLEGHLSAQERAFLSRNSDLFANQIEVPVYQNIAVFYKDEIMNEIHESAENQLAVQQAINKFEQDESVRKKLFQLSRERGQTTMPRTVRPIAGGAGQTDPPLQSIYISEPLLFSEITSSSSSGIIPRFTDDELTLLFWSRGKDGRIAGCVIDDYNFRDRIIGLLPNVYSPVRILTILDTQGRPLVAPREETARDWRRPFIAQEINEILPRWEVAAYLTDPDIVSSQANYAATMMWLLIFILIVWILGGGTLVLKALHSEITLARQKTTFVTNVSHELKTPLTSIRMMAEMLKEGRLRDEKKQRQYLEIIVAENERLTRLINNVLDFSKLEQGKKTYNTSKVNIAAICERMLESQKLRLEQKGFEVNFRHDCPFKEKMIVQADEEAVKQALLNLLSNAEKYSEQTRQIEIDVTYRMNFAVVNIKDRGIGIPPAEAKKIFKEFYRVHDELTARVQGTGLGLSIARHIIEDHGGELHHFPRDGGGSIFQLKLPLAEG